MSASNSGAESSSQPRRVSRKGSGKSSIATINTNNNKRSAKQEVVKSARETGGGNIDQAQTHQAEVSSEICPTPPSQEQVTAVESNIGQSIQQGGSPRKGRTPQKMEVVDAVGDSVVVVDSQQGDTATNTDGAPDNDVVVVDNQQDETATNIGGAPDNDVVVVDNQQDDTNIGRAPDNDAAEATPSRDTTQQEDASGVEASGVKKARSASTVAATEVETNLSSSQVQEDTPRTTQGVSGQNQPKQPSGSTPVSPETTTTTAPLPKATEANAQDRETTEENYTESPPSTKTSSAGDGEEVGSLDDIDEWDHGQDDGQDGGLGPETEETHQLVSAAVIEFVPTERSLAAYCEVRRDHVMLFRVLAYTLLKNMVFEMTSLEV